MNVAKQLMDVGELRYVDTAHCQQVFSVKQPGTLRRWAKQGAPHLRVGNQLRWNVPAVEGWLDARTKQTEEQSVD